MPISRVVDLWGFERWQQPVRRRSSGLRDRCVSVEPRAQRHRAFKRGLWCRQWKVLLNEAAGVRGGMILQDAAVKVLLIDTMPIMVGSKNPAAHGCAERARRSR
jgi:hypothetical protein